MRCADGFARESECVTPPGDEGSILDRGSVQSPIYGLKEQSIHVLSNQKDKLSKLHFPELLDINEMLQSGLGL